MGALTSKVYSFTLRPWELEQIEAVDVFDSLGSNIYIEKKDINIMRVIPRILNDFFWITDKIRFFFDGLLYQRLCVPLLMDTKIKQYKAISWELFFFYKKSLLSFINKKNTFNTYFFFIKDVLDLIDLISIKKFIYSLSNSYNIITGFMYNYTIINTDIFNNYFLDEFFLFKTNNILLIGCNLRSELPLIYKKLLKQLDENEDKKIWYFGYDYYSKLNCYNLGSNYINFCELRLFKNIEMEDMNNIYILFGSMFYTNINFEGYYILICNVFNFLKKKNYLEYKININYNFLLDFNKMILGFDNNMLFNSIVLEKKNVQKFYKINSNFKYYIYTLNFFIFINDIIYTKILKNLNKLQLYIYYGSHDSIEAKEFNFDIKLPIPYIYEKDSFFYTIIGEKIDMSYLYFPVFDNLIKSIYFINNLFYKINYKIWNKNSINIFINTKVYTYINKTKKKINKVTLFKSYLSINVNKIDFSICYLVINNYIYIYNMFVLNSLYLYYNFDLFFKQTSSLNLMLQKEYIYEYDLYNKKKYY